MKRYLILVTLISMASLAAKAASTITIPETVTVEKDYRVDGKKVTKSEALMSAVGGKTVTVCDQYRAEMSKSGTIGLKKVK